MTIEEILAKSNPVPQKRKTSHSEYKKIVDRNTELVDKMKDLQERIDKAIEILKDTSVEMPETLLIETIDYAIHILKGEDKE